LSKKETSHFLKQMWGKDVCSYWKFMNGWNYISMVNNKKDY